MNKSETIGELAKALVKFNAKVNKVSKDANNPFFKANYATLDNIIDEIRPILTENGLSILQIPSGDGQNVIMKTMLLHESGEFLESEELIMKPVKNDPQAVGSCISYARRYSLNSFLSLNTGEDDDGESATRTPNKPQYNNQNTNTPPTQNNTNTGSFKASDAQVKLLHTLTTKYMNKAGWEEAQVKQALTDLYGDFNMSYKEMSGGKTGQASQAITKLNELLK